MTSHHAHHEDHGARPANWSRLNQWLLWLGLAAAVAWLYVRHNEHLLQLLPFLIVLACPLLHLFGHGSHGGHGAAADTQPQKLPRDAEGATRGGGHAH